MPKASPSEMVVNLPDPGASERPPRQMSREDRRLIFAKLEEVYIDEKSGYSAGWNDDAVAKDMACPRAWVEEIREQNFGPQKSDQSAEVISIRAMLNGAEADIKVASNTLKLARTAHAEAEKDMTAAGELIASAAKAIEAARADIRKLTGRA
ncbi:hypothetical protein [Devosia ginsengisoli]|uniref:hypothetical protein n=1 Tax=Devosia ginsengisoli TaxID=400770 RepID=UPI0026EC6F79|nr:hypothetical protein [Devosia ginsengisoli]MCR6673294.1 hypothetical protein [Devosia ginsengisoli]